MSSFQLDSDGDLKLTANALTFTHGIEAIRQHLQVKFQLFFGEWFLDTGVGVPYFQEILTKKPTLVSVAQILKTVILETPGVLELKSFEFDFNPSTRVFELTFSCSTEEGDIDFTQEVGF